MTGETFQWRGDLAKDAVRRGARAAIEQTASALLDASLAVVPRRSNALAESAGTSLADYQPIGSVYYDDARDVKTVVQHENLTQHHPPGETSKFLERPARTMAGTFRHAAAREIGQELR